VEALKRLTRKAEFSEVLWGLAAKGVAAVFYTLVEVLLARAFPVSDYGVWAYLMSTLRIVAILSYLGINASARAYVAQHNHTPALRAVLRDALVLRLAASLGFTAGFLLLRGAIAGWLQRPAFESLFLAAVPLVFLMGMIEYLKAVFIGLQRLKPHFVVNIIEFGLKFALVGVCILAALTLRNVVWAFTLAELTAAAVGGWLVWGEYRRALPEEGSRQRYLGAVLRYGVPFFIINLGMIFTSEMDTQMLGVMSDELQLGYYGAAKQLVGKFPQLSLALSMGLMPAFARPLQGELSRMRQRFQKTIGLYLAVFTPIVIGLVLLAPLIVRLLYPPEYTPMVTPLRLLAVWVGMVAVNMVFSDLLDYRGKAGWRVGNNLLSIGLSFGLNLWLIPLYGATGAALGTVLAYVPYVLINLALSARLFRQSA
jgi:O-antigen/teichoic acid export membrane protein